MQGGVAQMKLSVISGHHVDPITDRLYQPLRAAIQQIDLPHRPQSPFQTELRHSMLPNRGQQNKIKESTMFPENMRLIETNNPLKRMRARSKTYKAISFDETFRTPLNSKLFRQEIKVHPARKKEVVYDYEPDSYQLQAYPAPLSPRPAPPTRVRSTTLVHPFVEVLANRVERVQSTTMQVHRKVPTTSVKAIPELKGQVACPQLMQVRSEKQLKIRGNPDFSSEYYQNCNKYSFNAGFKAKSGRSPQGERQGIVSSPNKERSGRSNSNYKYNLFSMMDEQTNLRCQNGFCTKNEIIASKRKKQW